MVVTEKQEQKRKPSEFFFKKFFFFLLHRGLVVRRQLIWCSDVGKGAKGDFSGSTSMDLTAAGPNAVEGITVGLQTPTLLKEWEVRFFFCRVCFLVVRIHTRYMFFALVFFCVFSVFCVCVCFVSVFFSSLFGVGLVSFYAFSMMREEPCWGSLVSSMPFFLCFFSFFWQCASRGGGGLF